MKAAALLFALLLAAAPALAEKALVVRLDEGIPSAMRNYLAPLYNSLGIDWRAVPRTTVNTPELRGVRYEELGGSVTQYDFLIIEDFRTGIGNCAGGTCGSLDSLLVAAGMPDKPTLIISRPDFASAGIWTDGNFDSSGFDANGAPPSGGTDGWQKVEYFADNPLRAWHQIGGFPKTPAGPVPPGYFRAILKQAPSPWYDYVKQGLAVSDWDSIRTGAGDTLSLVQRNKADANGNPTGPPLVLCAMGYGLSRNDGSLRRIICGLAVLHQASGGKLFYQTRPGPVTFAVQAQTIGATGQYTHSSSTGLLSHGGYWKATNDSTGERRRAMYRSFQERGIRMSFGVQMNPDSTGPGAPYREQIEELRDLYPLAHVFPFELGGLGGSNGFAGGNSSSTHNLDAFSASRLRALLPPGCDPREGCDCSTDTTSVLCNAKRQRSAVVAFFGEDRVDDVWGAPLEDWTPLWFGRGGGSIDSLSWVLNQFVGIKGLRVGNMGLENVAGTTIAGGPRGWFRNANVLEVRDPATGVPVSYMAFMPSRDAEGAALTHLASNGHDNGSEFLMGLFTGDWYANARDAIYVNGHDFFNRTIIFEVSVNWLVGPPPPAEQKPGYWYITDFAEWINTVNELAGETVIRMGYGEDAADWFIRSGLR